MVGAVLGLFAFILAFAFSMAAERYHDRQLALLDEANAIRATYLQAGMIAEPYRTEVRKVLRHYVRERLQWTGVEGSGGPVARVTRGVIYSINYGRRPPPAARRTLAGLTSFSAR